MLFPSRKSPRAKSRLLMYDAAVFRLYDSILNVVGAQTCAMALVILPSGVYKHAVVVAEFTKARATRPTKPAQTVSRSLVPRRLHGVSLLLRQETTVGILFRMNYSLNTTVFGVCLRVLPAVQDLRHPMAHDASPQQSSHFLLIPRPIHHAPQGYSITAILLSLHMQYHLRYVPRCKLVPANLRADQRCSDPHSHKPQMPVLGRGLSIAVTRLSNRTSIHEPYTTYGYTNRIRRMGERCFTPSGPFAAHRLCLTLHSACTEAVGNSSR